MAQRDSRRGRISKSRHNTLVLTLAEIVRQKFLSGDSGSLWGLEGPLRAGLRSNLCLKSWKWSDADAATRALLEEVFIKAGAERPAWDEGQPEWTIHAGTLIERTQCVRCHRPLPEGHFRFCGSLCRSAHHKMVTAIREADEAETYDKVVSFGGGIGGYEY